MDRIHSARLIAAYRYWEGLPRRHPWPLRKDLDPAAMSALVLPILFTVTPEKEPPFFRFGLAGTATYRFTGRDETRQLLTAENFGENQGDMADALQKTMSSGLPHWARAEMPAEFPDEGADLEIEAIFLPMTQNGAAPDYLLGAVDVASGRPLSVVFPTGLLLQKRWRLTVAPRPVGPQDLG